MDLVVDVLVAEEEVRGGHDDAGQPVGVGHPQRARAAPLGAARRVVRVVAVDHQATLQIAIFQTSFSHQ